MNNYRHTPLKWKKFHLLVDWKLRSAEDLLQTIKRYEIADYKKCCDDILQNIVKHNDNSAYIIKLVYPIEIFKLPNYIIRTEKDVVDTVNSLKTRNLLPFTEIWYCKSASGTNSVFGRLLFSLDDLFPRVSQQRLEIVWGNSARNLELYPNMPNSFASFERINWNAAFEPKEIILKENTKEEIFTISNTVIKYLNSFQKQIIKFSHFIQDCGCKHFNIEFRLVDGVFSIFDWDSDNDKLVLEKL